MLLPDGHDADQFREVALNTFNMSYGASFGPYAKKYFRIGHLGDINDATMIGALAATEMALELAGVPHKKGGVQAAMDYIVSVRSGGLGLPRSKRRSSLRGAQRRSNPESLPLPLDCFASLAMTNELGHAYIPSLTATPWRLPPSLSSGTSTNANAVNAAETSTSGASRLSKKRSNK